MSNKTAYHGLFAPIDTSAPPPVVSVNLGVTFQGGGLDGYVTAPFQGYDPAVTGQLTLALGSTAYQLPATQPALAPLQHVQAATPVQDATALVDLAFTTPGQTLGLLSEAPSNTDIGISSTTDGLSGILGPLTAALAGTTLGSELAPIVKLGKGLLPTLDKHGGVPRGGSHDAKPYLALNLGVGTSQTVTVLGHPTTTSQSGTLAVSGKAGASVVKALGDTAQLVTSAGVLLTDAASGNLAGAVADGAVTLAFGAAVTGDIGAVIAQAPHTPPTLPPIASPALDLTLNTGAEQDFALPIGSPVTVAETLGVQITADTFGAYALGKLLAQIAPQLVADLSGKTPVQQPLTVLSQLVGDVSTLAKDAAGGFTGLGNAGAVPSSVNKPDISIQVKLGVTEAQNTPVGSISSTQTFSTNLETNAQGFYDLGTAAQPAITDLLLGFLETPAGHEVLQIGGDILGQLDQKLGGGGQNPAADHAIGAMHATALPIDWR